MNNELLEMCLRIFKERSEYYFTEASKQKAYCKDFTGRALAYDSAYIMLKYAMEGHEECLRQFDYFTKED